LKLLASLADRKGGQAKISSKSNKALASFLDLHVLGMMAHFADVIDAPLDVHAWEDKLYCLCAIEDMLTMARDHFNFGIAIPQV